MTFSESPRYLQFFPTFRCDQRCAFCFNRGIGTEKDVSFGDFQRLIRVLLHNNIGELDILGGEPTLHPEGVKMISLSCQSGIRTSVSSNGLHPDVLSNLSEICDPTLLTLGISINSDSLPEALHDYIIRYKPLLKGVCTKKRVLPEFVKRYLEAPDIRYYLLYMDTPFPEDLRYSLPFPSFLRRLNTLKKTYKNIDGVFCSGFIPDTENYPHLSHVRCPAGTTKLSVMPDGSVYPCYLLFRHAEFRLGNILSDDFTKIWGNPVLDYFRSFERNKCAHSACDILSVCHGGCPAMGLLIYNNIDAPDPRCASYFVSGVDYRNRGEASKILPL